MRSRVIHVSVSSTETPANSGRLYLLRQLVCGLGIPVDEHLIRPLAKRGFSHEGWEMGAGNLVPEVTIPADGSDWHPLISPRATDMQMSGQALPLADAIEEIQKRLKAQNLEGGAERAEFT